MPIHAPISFFFFFFNAPISVASTTVRPELTPWASVARGSSQLLGAGCVLVSKNTAAWRGVEDLSHATSESCLSCLQEVWRWASYHLQTSICFLPPSLPSVNKYLLSVSSAEAWCWVLGVFPMDRSVVQPRQTRGRKWVPVCWGPSRGGGRQGAWYPACPQPTWLLTLIYQQRSLVHIFLCSHHRLLGGRWLVLHSFLQPRWDA